MKKEGKNCNIFHVQALSYMEVNFNSSKISYIGCLQRKSNVVYSLYGLHPLCEYTHTSVIDMIHYIFCIDLIHNAQVRGNLVIQSKKMQF